MAKVALSGAGSSRPLAEEVLDVAWYQTIELPGGLRTPGMFDTVAAARRSLMPASLDGKRCLDVATSNGFWAFEMERRGGSEVVAIDLGDPAEGDWPAFDPIAEVKVPPPLPGYEIAHRALGSHVDRRELSVYDVTREALGEFDVVFVGSLLLHLRDPVRALTALRQVTAGELVLNESVSIPLTLLRPRSPSARLIGTGGANWWVPNVVGLIRMVEAAGFTVIEKGRPYALPWGEGAPRKWGKTVQGARVRGLARNVGRALAGIPHVGLRAERLGGGQAPT